MPTSLQKWSAEFLGTFWLTFGGCGSAVLAAAFPQLGIGFLGVSLAFGLTVLTGAMAERVVLDDGRATGVTLRQGRQQQRAVGDTLGTRQMYNALGAGNGSEIEKFHDRQACNTMLIK